MPKLIVSRVGSIDSIFISNCLLISFPNSFESFKCRISMVWTHQSKPNQNSSYWQNWKLHWNLHYKLFPHVLRKPNPSPIINGPHNRHEECGRITWLFIGDGEHVLTHLHHGLHCFSIHIVHPINLFLVCVLNVDQTPSFLSNPNGSRDVFSWIWWCNDAWKEALFSLSSCPN